MAGLDYAHQAAEIIRDAGGQIVGRTKLQKIAFFLEVAGVGAGFPFRYKHFGPYSDQLAAATQHASALQIIREIEQVAAWGGLYSTFYSSAIPGVARNPIRARLAREMVGADAVELELAATAAFLSYEGYDDPWAETKRRKPDKAEGGRLDKAKQLFARLRSIPTPHPLPSI